MRRVEKRTSWFVLLLLAISCSFTLRAAETAAGTPGNIRRRAEVNFSDLALQESLTATQNTARVFIHRPKPGSQKLGAAAGTNAPAGGSPRAPRSPAASASPATTTNFLALLDNNTVIPPDVNGAVGPNFVFTALNGQVRTQDRGGNTNKTVSLTSFWAPLLDNPDPFDPRVVYDPSIQRFIFSAGANPPGDSSAPSLLVGISKTSDPSGVWYLYEVDADTNGLNFADFPTLGINRNWVTVSANMYPVNGNPTNGVSIFVFNKSALATNGPDAAVTPRVLMDNSGNGFTMVPAVTFDTNLNTEYLIEDWDNANGKLRISTITGGIGAETLTLGTAFPVSSNWEFTVTNVLDNLPQKGSAQRINAGDSRILNCVYRNGSLWPTHTVFLPTGAPTRTAAQWWQVTPAGAVQQFGRIEDTANVTFFAYPSIAVNARNDVLIGYSTFSTNQFASANYSLRFFYDTPGTLRGSALLKAGAATYVALDDTGSDRWGDFSSTAVDPVNDLTMWTLQEYAASPANSWGTWWGRVDMGSTLAFSRSGAKVVLTWTNTATLQSATNVTGPYTDVSGASSPFTNSAPPGYFRLSQ